MACLTFKCAAAASSKARSCLPRVTMPEPTISDISAAIDSYEGNVGRTIGRSFGNAGFPPRIAGFAEATSSPVAILVLLNLPVEISQYDQRRNLSPRNQAIRAAPGDPCLKGAFPT